MPAHKILVLIAYVQMPPLNTYDDVSRGTRGLFFDLSNSLLPNLVYVGSEGSGESAHMLRLV